MQREVRLKLTEEVATEMMDEGKSQETGLELSEGENGEKKKADEDEREAKKRRGEEEAAMDVEK